MTMVKEILEWAIQKNEEELTSAKQDEKFWHDRYIDLAKEVMCLAGLPDDFSEHGLQDAFAKLKGECSHRYTDESGKCIHCGVVREGYKGCQ